MNIKLRIAKISIVSQKVSSEQDPLNFHVMSSAHTRDPPPESEQSQHQDTQQQQHTTPQQERRYVTVHTNHGDWTFAIETNPDNMIPVPRTPGEPINGLFNPLRPRPNYAHFNPNARPPRKEREEWNMKNIFEWTTQKYLPQSHENSHLKNYWSKY